MAGVVAVLKPETGAVGTVRTTLPVGAGLSSSAALEVAVALALGFEGTPHELALACQFRIAVPPAKFGFPEVKLGVIPKN